MNTNNTHNDPDNEDEISLKELILKLGDWWRYLLSKWLIILVVGLIGGGLGLMYSTSKKPVYTASTTFVLEEGGNGLGQYAGIAAMAGIDLGGSGGGIFQGDNLLELYKSRSMILKTLLSEIEYHGRSELLVDYYIKINKLRESWAEKPELKNIQFHNIISDNSNSDAVSSKPKSRLQDSIINTIVNDINTNYLSVSKPDKKLSIIKVSVKSEDEIFAKAFNDQIVKNVNDFYVQTKTKKTLENLAILQYQTDSVRLEMERAVYSTASSLDATPNLNPAKQVLRTGVQRSQFSAETNKAILTELIKNLEMTKMTLQKETPLIQVIDGPVYPLEIEKFGKAKGIVLGGLLFGFLTVMFLLLKKLFNNIINS